jgi:hypothetical protein
MTARRESSLRAFAVAALTAACASGCAALVSKGEYADYRAVRMERDDDARLLAMRRYVERHPQGRWHTEIQRERLSRERAVFDAGRSHRAGLELYIAAFPDGAFAAQAKSRLEAIAVIEQRKRDEATLAARLAEERRVREDELSRTWVTRFFGYWVKTLVQLEGWGTPIEQVARGNAEFARAFGRPPRPRCTLSDCVKSYESAYAVPVPGGTRLERSMRLALRLHMREGRFERAELLLPNYGFSRWQELEDKRVVVDADAEGRTQALVWALERVVPVIDALELGRAPIEEYALPSLAPLGSGSGELTDTTAEDPSAPPNRIQGSAVADPSQPSPEQLVQPTAPEPEADLEMDTLHVDREGRARPGAAPELVLDPVVVPQPGQEGAQGEMVLDPLAVPREGGGTPGSSAAARGAAGDRPSQTAPALPMVRAFRVGELRIVVFAAGPGDPAGLDGMLIERVPARSASGSAHGKNKASAPPKKPAAPR